jgi:hypothetical protein
MILFLDKKPTLSEIQAMLEEFGRMIKIAVDIRRSTLVGGGEMHADCEQLLLQNGSEQDDIWEANWYPADKRIELDALINICPRMGNRGILIQSEDIRNQVEAKTRQRLELNE